MHAPKLGKRARWRGSKEGDLSMAYFDFFSRYSCRTKAFVALKGSLLYSFLISCCKSLVSSASVRPQMQSGPVEEGRGAGTGAVARNGEQVYVVTTTPDILLDMNFTIVFCGWSMSPQAGGGLCEGTERRGNRGSSWEPLTASAGADANFLLISSMFVCLPYAFVNSETPNLQHCSPLDPPPHPPVTCIGVARMPAWLTVCHIQDKASCTTSREPATPQFPHSHPALASAVPTVLLAPSGLRAASRIA